MIGQLQKAVDYIDANIDCALNLDMISRHIGFSKYYLNHVFSIYTGFSIMAYVRKKKLEYAIDEMKTNKRILDIALDCGYSSERAFSRAVVNEPEDAIIDIMNRLADTYGLDIIRSFGFDSPVEGTEDVTKLRGYEYWLSVDDSMLAKLPDKEGFAFEGTVVSIKRIPGYRYATLRITDPMVDPFERIGTGWRFLVSWLEDRDFKEPDFKHDANINCLEEVKMADGVMVMDIYIPIDAI